MSHWRGENTFSSSAPGARYLSSQKLEMESFKTPGEVMIVILCLNGKESGTNVSELILQEQYRLTW